MKIEEKEENNIGKLDSDVDMMDVEETNVDLFHSNHSPISIYLFNEKEKQLLQQQSQIDERNEKEEINFENEKNKIMEAEKQEENVDLEPPPLNGDKPLEQSINTVQR